MGRHCWKRKNITGFSWSWWKYKSERTKQFSEILRHAHIPYQKVMDMHMWQLCHLAMVVPIADAYYEANCPERAGKEWKKIRLWL